jgi:hypothetical protein
VRAVGGIAGTVLCRRAVGWRHVGARALMLAVLEDAVQCIQEGHHGRRFHARRLAAEAEAWVRSDHTSWPFSFVNICEVLGFDAGAVRGRLLRNHGDASDRYRDACEWVSGRAW